MRNARLDESQAGIKIAGRNINNLRYSDDTTLMTFCHKQRGTKEPPDEGERGECKSHGIQCHHFMQIVTVS